MPSSSAKNLVIVESPAKGRTIEHYLGSGYKVLASFGHVRDLPKRELGVDVKHGYAPRYVIPPKSNKVVAALKAELKTTRAVYLATDLDREGEAIAWHIIVALGLDKSSQAVRGKLSSITVHRITFSEITKSAVESAILHPRQINENLVNSQQARRVLDRLVGYSLSPFLWKKIYQGLSAGRVQSVAVRLIVEREGEIKTFTPREYWSVEADLQKRSHPGFRAFLAEEDGKKLDKLAVPNAAAAQAIQAALQDGTWTVRAVDKVQEKRYPGAPFTTSTLQQTASNRLRFSAKKTMRIAQDLYEAGLITYMRTDSVALSADAVAAIRAFISKTFGARYLPPTVPRYATRTRRAQEAHEAIRPTDVSRIPQMLKQSADHQKLYELIWRRTVASQMEPALLAITSAMIDARSGEDKTVYGFKATGTAIVFEGAWKVWPRGDENAATLPPLKVGEDVDFLKLHLTQHFTEPPPRYTEASLIKALEERGIGRPSTYAPILSTIQDRGYVRLEQRRFYPEEVGEMVTNLLVEHFPEVIDYDFTAKIEDELDEIAAGRKQWAQTIDNFYKPFAVRLAEKEKTVTKQTVMEPIGRDCPECGRALVTRMGRFGKFISCSGFPECRHAEQIIQKIGVKCPQCQEGDVIERRTKTKRRFWGCSRYPNCKWASWTKPVKQPLAAGKRGS